MLYNKWLRLRFGIEKDCKIIYLDYRHFHTAQNVMDLFPMKSCILKLYDEHKELKPQDMVKKYRDYTLKRHPRSRSNFQA